MITLRAPLDTQAVEALRAGDRVLVSGTVYTARDQAHKRMVEALAAGKRLPFDARGQIIYYCGPTGTPKGRVIGSCGPTTAGRMDAFTPALLEAGAGAMIGKGGRSRDVVDAIRKHKAVYLLAYAGCGALASTYVAAKRLVAYGDLGPEAVYALEVEEFPCFVGIDSGGTLISSNYQFEPGG